MLRARLMGAAILLLLPVSCFGTGAEVTEDGKGLPRIVATFPDSVPAGAEVDAELTISNPGPDDMEVVAITFAPAAPLTGSQDIPQPIVDRGRNGSNPAVVTTEPEVTRISDDGLVFLFGPLEEGEETTIVFTLRVPERPGAAGNSVQVYDGRDLERIRGTRIDTVVER